MHRHLLCVSNLLSIVRVCLCFLAFCLGSRYFSIQLIHSLLLLHRTLNCFPYINNTRHSNAKNAFSRSRHPIPDTICFSLRIFVVDWIRGEMEICRSRVYVSLQSITQHSYLMVNEVVFNVNFWSILTKANLENQLTVPSEALLF